MTYRAPHPAIIVSLLLLALVSVLPGTEALSNAWFCLSAAIGLYRLSLQR